MDKHLHPNHSCETCQPLRPANSPLWGPHLSRRSFFEIAGTGVAGYFLAPLAFGTEAKAAAADAKLVNTARNVIFIHMQGAPSHVDTFDLKVGSWTPADFNPTQYNGVWFPQGLMPKVAEHFADKIAVVRSLRAPALVHSLQQMWTQISRNPTSLMGKIAPNLGSVVARELESQRRPNQKLPGFISLNGGNVVGSGYFNAKYTPFAAAAAQTGLAGLTHPDGQTNFDRRFQMLMELDGGTRANSPLGGEVVDMDGFYQQSRAMMYNAEIDAVFRFTNDDALRYGIQNGANRAATGFGNSLIVARNLVKANLGARFIHVSLGGWDNHTNIYAPNAGIYPSARQFDSGLGNLLTDLSSQPGVHGGATLLDETLVVAMGEFGRTVRGPQGVGLNSGQGRDHFFQHFTMFAGGGVVGGTIIGQTTADGSAVQEAGWSANRPVANEDIAATIYSALGIDYTKTLRDDPYQRGFDLVPFASYGAWEPVLELFTRGPKQRPRIAPRTR